MNAPRTRPTIVRVASYAHEDCAQCLTALDRDLLLKFQKIISKTNLEIANDIKSDKKKISKQKSN